MLLKSHIKSLGFLDSISSIKEAALVEPILHRAEYEFAISNGGKLLREFASKIEAGPGWMFDVRVHFLKQRQLPAIDAFHLDFWNDAASTAVIAVVGDCSLTEFLAEDVQVDDPHNVVLPSHAKVNTYQMQDREIVEYSTSTLHRATPATKNGWRVFLRGVKLQNLCQNLVLNGALIWEQGNTGEPNYRMWIDDGVAQVAKNY